MFSVPCADWNTGVSHRQRRKRAYTEPWPCPRLIGPPPQGKDVLVDSRARHTRSAVSAGRPADRQERPAGHADCGAPLSPFSVAFLADRRSDSSRASAGGQCAVYLQGASVRIWRCHSAAAHRYGMQHEHSRHGLLCSFRALPYVLVGRHADRKPHPEKAQKIPLCSTETA